MSQDTYIKHAERKVFTASFDDGLLDIFISCWVLMFAVAPYLSGYLGDFWSSAIFLPFWGLVYLVLRWVRKHLVIPRIGVMKGGAIRRRKLSIFSLVMLAINVIFFVLASVFALTPVGTGWSSALRFGGMFGVMLLISFSITGYFLDLPRLYLYGLMLALAMPVGEWLYRMFGVPHHGFPVVFGFSAAILFLVGVVRFVILLNDNPLPAEEFSL